MTWEAQNVASANISGYEIGLNYQFNNNLKAFINYTGLRAIDDSTGKYLVYRPVEQHNWGIQYNDPSGNSAGILMRHVGERYDNSDNSRNVDAYTVTDIKCGIKIMPQMQIELGVDNFFNEEYQDTYDYPMPGRIYTFGIKYDML
jgi:outer membrane cobalamin receptor